MTAEQKQAMEEKALLNKKKQEERDAAALIELNKIREANSRPAVVIE